MSVEDARLVQGFAERMQPLLRYHDYTRLLEEARTVGRIAYCCIADARQKTRFFQKHGKINLPRN